MSMRIFANLYNKILNLANTKYSIYYLSFISILESFILPYPPPDVLLAPMVLQQKKYAYKLAFICTVFSVLGGIIGYLLGAYFIDIIMPFIQEFGLLAQFNDIKKYFNIYGILIMLIAGFSPIPYKIFTIAAGSVNMNLLFFILISIIARGVRFFLLTFIVKKYGYKCDNFLQKYIDYIGYGVIIIVFIFITWSYYENS